MAKSQPKQALSVKGQWCIDIVITHVCVQCPTTEVAWEDLGQINTINEHKIVDPLVSILEQVHLPVVLLEHKGQLKGMTSRYNN